MIKRLPDVCTVRLGDDLRSSEDFIAILTDDTGKAELLYSTDALTIGIALKLLSRTFVTHLNACTLEERDEITSILGEEFILEEVTQCKT